MNIHYPQVERKSQSSSHMLTAFAICMAMMLVLNLIRYVEIRWSIPSISVQAAQIENGTVPIAIPAPLSPAEAIQATSTPEPDGNASSNLMPQAIPAPAPSVP